MADWQEHDKIRHMNKHALEKPFIVIVVLVVAAIACSLTAEPPATLPPRTPISTLTPQGPIGPQASVQAPPQQLPPQIPTSIIPQVPPNPSITSQIELVDGNRMMNTISTLVGYQNRNVLGQIDPDRGIQAAGNYIFLQFEQLKQQYPNSRIDVYEQQFVVGQSQPPTYARNIIMAMNGTDTSAPIVVIGAHYDTINIQNGSYQPGANDNGSGVAAVLEIARVLASTNHRGSVLFVLFSGEELGRYGSLAFLNEYILASGIHVTAMINLDIVGSPTGANLERYDNQMRLYASPPSSGTQSQQLGRMVEFVARYFLPDMQVNIEPTVDRAGRWSDHMTFSDAGINAIRLIEQADEPARAHTTRDTMEDIEPDYLRRTTQVALAAIIVLIDGPNPPASIRVDPSNWRIDWLPSPGATRYVLAMRRPNSLIFDTGFTSDVTSLTWPDVHNYESISIAAVDALGQIGPFSSEIFIPTVTLSQ